MKLISFLLLMTIMGCGYQLTAIKVELPNGFYDQWSEKGFCWSQGKISNVHQGGIMSSPIPVCNSDAIVIHTHPVWAERGANFVDFAVWNEYRSIYGNELFGVCGDEWCKIYAFKGP